MIGVASTPPFGVLYNTRICHFFYVIPKLVFLTDSKFLSFISLFFLHIHQSIRIPLRILRGQRHDRRSGLDRGRHPPLPTATFPSRGAPHRSRQNR